jgi:hypothetical protein
VQVTQTMVLIGRLLEVEQDEEQSLYIEIVKVI